MGTKCTSYIQSLVLSKKFNIIIKKCVNVILVQITGFGTELSRSQCETSGYGQGIIVVMLS